MKFNPGLLEKYYNIQADGDSEVFLTEIAKRNNLVVKKGLPDIDRSARLVLKAWQKGLIKNK